MKRTSKRLLSCSVILVLCLSLVSSAFLGTPASASDDIFTTSGKNRSFFISQSNSIDAFESLLDSFSSTTYVTKTPSTIRSYPDYYGGAYIDESTGELIVLVTDLSAVTQSAKSALGPKGSSFKLCSVSYNEIIQAVDAVTRKFDYFKSLGINIAFAQDDIKNGKVLVGVENLTSAKEETLRKVLNCPYLSLVNSDKPLTSQSYGGGTPITSANDGAASTLGYAATKYINGTPTPGFVIAGHAGNTIGEQFMAGSTLLGTVTHTAWVHNGASIADAAFVTASTGATTTNLMHMDGLIVGTVDGNLPLDTVVHQYGLTTQLTAGKVTASYVSVSPNYNNGASTCLMYAQTAADYAQNQGDSGGPVMIYTGENFGALMLFNLCGIHSCGYPNSTAYFTPYSNIVSAIGAHCVLTQN